MSSVIVVKQGAGRAVIAAGLRGRPGDPGEQGQDGTPFQVDATGLLANRDAFDGEDEGFSYLATDTGDLYFRQGAVGSWSGPVPFQGPAGDSAYQVAVNNGFVGTEAEWLEALKGADGANGTDGADGTDGLSIIGAAIDGNGHLQLTLSNSTLLDAGLVVGMDGADGADGDDGRGIASMAIDGSNHLIITYTDSSTEDAGLIPGAGGSASWGSIGGTLADQADLAAALADKANSADLATVAVTGSYADLSDKPAIPGTAAEVGAIPSAEKGAANGVAPLDSGAKIAAAYLPSFVDDVLEFANLAAFPAIGESGKIYVALDTNKSYRWGGSSYIEISPSPGSTDAVAEGATNFYFTVARVLGAVISGLSLATGGTIANGETVLVALGKLQKQITDLVAALAGKAPAATTRTISGTTGTLVPSDNGAIILCTSSSPVTLTIQAEASAAWADASVVHIIQMGAGIVTVADGSGITVNVFSGLTKALRGQYAQAALVRSAANTFALAGTLGGTPA